MDCDKWVWRNEDDRLVLEGHDAAAIDLAADAEAGHNSGDMPGVVFELDWLLIGALSEISDFVANQYEVLRGEGQLGRLEEARVRDHCEAEAGGVRCRRQDQER